ncbi:dynamin family protein, partial [Terribacillus saccharophilus]|uniref:dynamin family protein n=1 Tax=Terribacillus saccharophilus TaxID=361277 RepID=UPI002DCADDD1|nr:dynamin family protein [Terribacillus saccharophilus]
LYSRLTAIKEINRQLEKDTFKIVVVGEFSRGKSTFINALAGEKMLPSSVKPTTTLLNIISHSPSEFLKLHFKSGKESFIGESEFRSLVAPAEPRPGDKEAEKRYEQQLNELDKIKYVEIGRPLSFCEAGVEIIDTPGTNDLDPARAEITNTIIPQADAAILLLSARKILSKSEESFLRDRILASDIQKVFVVINFKDDFDEQEQSKIMDYARTHLSEILGEPKIHIISAKQALNARRKLNGEALIVRSGKPIPTVPLEDTGILELESALAEFLQYDRGIAKLGKPIHSLERLIHSILEDSLPFQRNSLFESKENIAIRIQEYQNEIKLLQKNGRKQKKDISLQIRQELKQLEKWHDTELKLIKQAAENACNKHIQKSPETIKTIVEEAIAPLDRLLHEKKEVRKQKIENDIISKYSSAFKGELLAEFRFQKENTFYDPKDYLPSISSGVWNFVIRIFDFFMGVEAREQNEFKRSLTNHLDRLRKHRSEQLEQNHRQYIEKIERTLDNILQEEADKLEDKVVRMRQHIELESQHVEEELKSLKNVEQSLKEILHKLHNMKTAMQERKVLMR